MPFTIELNNSQKTEKWTFKRTNSADQLQDLLDKDDRVGYIELLKTLSETGKFTRTKGVVYEMFDEGETIIVPVRFQVKNSVITWAFVAPMDSTHQSFRDEVFNTAAKAHACVTNACQTYYRGTNHYHLKVMHSYAEESEFNHNHYRVQNKEPITPLAVYEHLFAFCAQIEGKKFIPTTQERDEIILKYAIFWAEYNSDINYVIFSFLHLGGGKSAVISQLEQIAEIGTLTPD